MYACFQNGKRCRDYGLAGWQNDEFGTKREAEIYCYLWSYGTTYQDADCCAPIMELSVPVDMSTTEVPVMMEVRSTTRHPPIQIIESMSIQRGWLTPLGRTYWDAAIRSVKKSLTVDSHGHRRAVMRRYSELTRGIDKQLLVH